MSFHPYLFFNGNCREAFTQYQQVFGGELTLIRMADMPSDEAPPPEMAEMIMHAALISEGNLLMASDDPTGGSGQKTGISVNFTTPDHGTAEKVFAGLADGGQVTMALAETSWSPKFGMCVDRFGIPWMINVDPTTTGG